MSKRGWLAAWYDDWRCMRAETSHVKERSKGGGGVEKSLMLVIAKCTCQINPQSHRVLRCR